MYTFTEREKLYKLFEELTGARFTTSYSRIGGVARDVPEGWLGARGRVLRPVPAPILEEVLNLLTRNKIFMDRTVGIGVIPREDAIAYGLTGPNLRGLRRAARPAQGQALQRLRAVRIRRRRRHDRATATTATSCAARRCASPSGSSGRRSRSFPPGPGTPRTRSRSSRRRRTRSSPRWRS